MKKLTKKQKAKNKAAYKVVRKEYDKVKDKRPDVTYLGFKHRVKSRMIRDNISWREAAMKEANTETFVSAAERSRKNLVESIKEKHRPAYDELKNLSRNKGKYQKIKENLTWDSSRNGYVLNAGTKQYYIDVSNSPEEVTITEIQ